MVNKISCVSRASMDVLHLILQRIALKSLGQAIEKQAITARPPHFHNDNRVH